MFGPARYCVLVIALVGLTSCDDIGPPGENAAPEVRSVPIAPVTYDALYVVNGEAASISVLNAETNTVTATIKLEGVSYPYRIVVSPDRSLLALAVPGFDMSSGHGGHGGHGGQASTTRGYVVLLDAVTGERRNALRISAANHNAVFLPGSGSQIWSSQVTNPGSTLVMDTDTLRVRDAVWVGNSPSNTSFTPDGRYALVANTDSASVSVIDVAERRVVKALGVGIGPVGAWPSPGRHAYVDNAADRSISVIDTEKLEVVRTIDLDYEPSAIGVPNEDEIWVTNGAGGVVEVRGPAGDLRSTIATGRGAHQVEFSGDGTTAYVSNMRDSTVSVIDRTTRTVSKTILVGAQPNGLAWRAK
jgi:YVTN family beta-propeller protein